MTRLLATPLEQTNRCQVGHAKLTTSGADERNTCVRSCASADMSNLYMESPQGLCRSECYTKRSPSLYMTDSSVTTIIIAIGLHLSFLLIFFLIVCQTRVLEGQLKHRLHDHLPQQCLPDGLSHPISDPCAEQICQLATLPWQGMHTADRCPEVVVFSNRSPATLLQSATPHPMKSARPLSNGQK